MRWLVALVVCTGIGVVLYSQGAPYWLVYFLRGLARHAIGH